MYFDPRRSTQCILVYSRLPALWGGKWSTNAGTKICQHQCHKHRTWRQWLQPHCTVSTGIDQPYLESHKTYTGWRVYSKWLFLIEALHRTLTTVKTSIWWGRDTQCELHNNVLVNVLSTTFMKMTRDYSKIFWLHYQCQNVIISTVLL